NEGKTLLMYTTPYWIPFFDLQNGNFLAFDFAPDTKGSAGQIIRFGADQEIGYIQADRLDLFLESLMDVDGDIQ
ncbi:MAG TPA: cell wall assembly/cell proliferation coordinating protein, partial [Maribacter sp.]|nr:cell wall assembly/cell proliferation coordinating protein [Maribacter sp.]